MPRVATVALAVALLTGCAADPRTDPGEEASATLSSPYVDEVTVEGRDSTHGWGGGTVTVTVPS